MKVVINKTGKVVEIRQREVDRLINRGKAHPFIESEIKEEPIKAELVFDGIEVKPKVKVVTDIDLIEPIPERFTSFEESKPKRKRKKKSKFVKWND